MQVYYDGISGSAAPLPSLSYYAPGIAVAVTPKAAINASFAVTGQEGESPDEDWVHIVSAVGV